VTNIFGCRKQDFLVYRRGCFCDVAVLVGHRPVTDRWTQICSTYYTSIALHEVNNLLHSRQVTTSVAVTAVVQNVRCIVSTLIVTGLNLQKQNFKYTTEQFDNLWNNLGKFAFHLSLLHLLTCRNNSFATSVFTSVCLFYQHIWKKLWVNIHNICTQCQIQCGVQEVYVLQSAVSFSVLS